MNLTPTIVQKTEKKNKLYYTGEDPYYNLKNKPTSDQQFHNVSFPGNNYLSFYPVRDTEKKLQLYDKEIVHGSKFFTFFLVLNETVEYLNPT